MILGLLLFLFWCIIARCSFSPSNSRTWALDALNAVPLDFRRRFQKVLQGVSRSVQRDGRALQILVHLRCFRMSHQEKKKKRYRKSEKKNRVDSYNIDMDTMYGRALFLFKLALVERLVKDCRLWTLRQANLKPRLLSCFNPCQNSNSDYKGRAVRAENLLPLLL